MDKKQRIENLTKRKAARLAAIQTLYQVEANQEEVERVIQQFALQLKEQKKNPEEELDSRDDWGVYDYDSSLFGEIAKGTSTNLEDIDAMIASVLPEGWPIERLDAVLRSILRLGTYELAYCPSTPMKVIISQYVELSHAFFSEKEPGLVNGSLDKMAKTLRFEEVSQK